MSSYSIDIRFLSLITCSRTAASSTRGSSLGQGGSVLRHLAGAGLFHFSRLRWAGSTGVRAAPPRESSLGGCFDAPRAGRDARIRTERSPSHGTRENRCPEPDNGVANPVVDLRVLPDALWCDAGAVAMPTAFPAPEVQGPRGAFQQAHECRSWKIGTQGSASIDAVFSF